MNKIHKSIQHIQKDLVLMTGLLKRKSLESIFVDIYSKDPVVLKSSKSFLQEKLEKEASIDVIPINSREDLKKVTMENWTSGQGQDNDVLKSASITDFAIFDKMSGEMIRLSRFPFILKWQRKLKGLVINPLTLLLVGPGRLFMNLALLAATYYAYQTLPRVSMVEYFLGASSPVYYGLWIPYIILLAFDARYVSRLYLLISEMAKRSMKEDENEKINRQTVYVIDPSIRVHAKTADRIKHVVLRKNAHFLRFTDNENTLNFADITFKVPQPSREMLLQYMGVLSGLEEAHKMESETLNQSFNFKPIPARILESFSQESEVLDAYTASTCKKFILNFEFLSERFNISNAEQEELAKLLLRKFSHKSENTSAHEAWSHLAPYL